jgi:RNA polymerase sigma factor (sigma-70 family)|tara:strand:+ start:623 stop:1120 length:498 start_codon:yes stop_codon:yes gene_type:complete
MTIDDVIHKLYMKHPTWVLMAERMTPLFYSLTAEDVVQEVYLKIFEELKKNKLKISTIIVDDKVKYSIVYLRMRNIVVDMMRSEKQTLPINIQIEDKQVESEAEFYEKIDNVINGFDWFHKKLFTLYTKKYQSIRDLSKDTKISYMTVWRHVEKCKNEIRNKMKK